MVKISTFSSCMIPNLIMCTEGIRWRHLLMSVDIYQPSLGWHIDWVSADISSVGWHIRREYRPILGPQMISKFKVVHFPTWTQQHSFLRNYNLSFHECTNDYLTFDFPLFDKYIPDPLNNKNFLFQDFFPNSLQCKVPPNSGMLVQELKSFWK